MITYTLRAQTRLKEVEEYLYENNDENDMYTLASSWADAIEELTVYAHRYDRHVEVDCREGYLCFGWSDVGGDETGYIVFRGPRRRERILQLDIGWRVVFNIYDA